MSADVGLSGAASAESDIAQAAEVAIAAYQREGLQVETEVRSTPFARLEAMPLSLS